MDGPGDRNVLSPVAAGEMVSIHSSKSVYDVILKNDGLLLEYSATPMDPSLFITQSVIPHVLPALCDGGVGSCEPNHDWSTTPTWG